MELRDYCSVPECMKEICKVFLRFFIYQPRKARDRSKCHKKSTDTMKKKLQKKFIMDPCGADFRVLDISERCYFAYNRKISNQIFSNQVFSTRKSRGRKNSQPENAKPQHQKLIPYLETEISISFEIKFGIHTPS